MDARQESKSSEMGLPHIESFCCCLGLETGARVVGVMHLVVGPCARSARIATTILLANPAVKQQCLHCCVSAWRLAATSFVVICSLFAHDAGSYVGTVEDAGDHLYSIWYKLAVGFAVVAVVHVLLALALLYAVHKRHVTVLRAYVYIMCMLYVAALLYIIITALLRGVSGSGSDIFLAFLEGLVVFGFLAYCILCVNSYYLLLRSAKDMEGPNTPY
ncbi:hypothetical protein MSG28_004863 [Choristoneura fumiferana]|uniref:Uncharacterized protein n=1 Tax=Choristoneura fumiferana TaxID=7141 RepID=A0ACC0K7W0_CHOFU|nr:hypothetical protein MSG28_004863 [Choristoneura fumiferana]